MKSNMHYNHSIRNGTGTNFNPRYIDFKKHLTTNFVHKTFVAGANQTTIHLHARFGLQTLGNSVGTSDVTRGRYNQAGWIGGELAAHQSRSPMMSWSISDVGVRGNAKSGLDWSKTRCDILAIERSKPEHSNYNLLAIDGGESEASHYASSARGAIQILDAKPTPSRLNNAKSSGPGDVPKSISLGNQSSSAVTYSELAGLKN
ncbi:hypothetical protein C8F04DRAFT_1185861 [Mycena alexandri]|uniref:Uncharacterized protein n=1 Tax=Mycena alexandri TaxID=1745969 RepID=A0AAD6SP03_9AGAR|nr:hypothetical protein C8F04DRAFT_1185861 [Mycena alexandri]